MNDALTYFYYIFNKLITLVFDDLEIFSGVTIGWVVTCCFVFGILLYNILALPNKAPTTHNAYRPTQTISRSYNVGGDRITYSARYKN